MAQMTELKPLTAEKIKIHCPFGCEAEDCDENGYCQHLVGFSNDTKTLEPLEDQTRFNKEDKEWQSTSYMRVNGKKAEKVQDDDVLVNPIIREKDFQSKQEYDRYSWVSWRVYSNDPNRETELIPKPAKGKLPVRLRRPNKPDEADVKPNHKKRPTAKTTAGEPAGE